MQPEKSVSFISSTKLASRKICVAMPCYNEAAAIGTLLEKIANTFSANQLNYEVIVVNDGSSDETAEIAYAAGHEMPIRVVEHAQNSGLDRAIDTCLRAAYQRCNPGDTIITLDADDTHPPKLMDKMIGLIDEGYDIVIASRFQTGARVVGVPWYRVWLAKGCNLLCRMILPIAGVRDFTCGYRAYRFEVLDQTLNYYGDEFVTEKGFSCMVDILLKMRRFGFIIGEVPLLLRYDQKETPSKMNVASTVLNTFKLFLKRRLGGY